MIPKLIHQTAKTLEIPSQLRGYVDTVKSLHPDWHYKLWTDEDNLAFVRAEFPDFLEIYTRLPKNIMRADVIRYLLMSRVGGLYLDTDYEMLKPFDLLDHGVVLPWESNVGYPADQQKIANAIFASEPGHPFWTMLIDDLHANPPLSPDVSVLEATGPAFVTRVYHRAKTAGLNMHTPHGELFCPPCPRNERAYQAIVRKGVSYGIHHCYGSWREYTTLQKVKDRVGKAINRFR